MRVTGAICEYKVSFAFARVSTKSLFTCPVSLIRGLVEYKKGKRIDPVV